MPLFNITLDVKETIWHRSTAEIEANSLEEAQQEIIRMRKADEYEVMTSDYMIETGCPLTPSELFLLDNVDMCLPDADEFANAINSTSAYDFPGEENYRISDDEDDELEEEVD
jgi:hypothetical protein